VNGACNAKHRLFLDPGAFLTLSSIWVILFFQVRRNCERGMTLAHGKGNPIANPLLVLREEFDDWAVLFNPDSGDAYGLNPVGVFVWKLLDGLHTEEDIFRELKTHCDDVPGDANLHVIDFVEDLVKKGFVGYEVAKA